MFKLWVLAFCAFLLVNTGLALKCYTCIASPNSDCFRGVVESYVIQECKNQTATNANTTTNPAQRPITNVCVEFTSKDGNPKVFERGCGYIYEDVDICEYLKLVSKVQGCSSCKTDLCNVNAGTVGKKP